MAAPKTVKTVTLDGSTKDFEIPFEYLARKFVVLTLIGTDRKELVLNVDYRFTQRTIVTTTQVWGPGSGYTLLEIKRVTSATERLVDFSDGSILRASDLNTATVQALHIAEEGRDIATDTIGVDNDGNLDARGRRIVNLADAVNPGDAVTLKQNQEWAGSALNSANAAKVSENAAKSSENAAKASENSAKASENSSASSSNTSVQYAGISRQWASREVGSIVADGMYSAFHYATKASESASASETSRLASGVSASNSANSASSSLTQANRAEAEADRAEAEADKLGNMNALGAAIESVSGTSVTWKGIQVWKGDVSVFGQSGSPSMFLRNANGAAWVRFQWIASSNVATLIDYQNVTRWKSDPNGLFTVPSLLVEGNMKAMGSNVSVQEATAGGGAYFNLLKKDGTEGALVWAYGSNTLNFRVGGSANQWNLSQDGIWRGRTNAGSDAQIDTTGNITGTAYGVSTSIRKALQDLQKPRRVQSVTVEVNARGSYIFDLPSDVWEYDEWLYYYGGQLSSLGPLIGFANAPAQTPFYTLSSPYWMQAKFIDTIADQRRILQFTGFASGANGPTRIYGVKYRNVI